MSDKHENALIAIADPIVWRCIQSDGEDGPSIRCWEGQHGDTVYQIHAPDRYPQDVDASPFDLSWYVTVYHGMREKDYEVLIVSAEEGKAVCARHALTQDLNELNALQQETLVATKDAQWFMHQKDEAVKQFMGGFFGSLLRARTWLKWLPEEKFAHEYQATGTRGSYVLRFTPGGRWSVTVTHKGQTVPGPCFVTNHIACMACSYYDYSGEWHLTLPTTPGASPFATSEE